MMGNLLRDDRFMARKCKKAETTISVLKWATIPKSARKTFIM